MPCGDAWIALLIFTNEAGDPRAVSFVEASGRVIVGACVLSHGHEQTLRFVVNIGDRRGLRHDFFHDLISNPLNAIYAGFARQLIKNSPNRGVDGRCRSVSGSVRRAPIANATRSQKAVDDILGKEPVVIGRADASQGDQKRSVSFEVNCFGVGPHIQNF